MKDFQIHNFLSEIKKIFIYLFIFIFCFSGQCKANKNKLVNVKTKHKHFQNRMEKFPEDTISFDAFYTLQ